MSLNDIAQTSQGPMVGDYISTSFSSAGTATALIAVGKPHTGSVFDEGMYAAAPLAVAAPAAATRLASSDGVQAIGRGVAEAIRAARAD
jgi:hypothetical protein